MDQSADTAAQVNALGLPVEQSFVGFAAAVARCTLGLTSGPARSLPGSVAVSDASPAGGSRASPRRALTFGPTVRSAFSPRTVAFAPTLALLIANVRLRFVVMTRDGRAELVNLTVTRYRVARAAGRQLTVIRVAPRRLILSRPTRPGRPGALSRAAAGWPVRMSGPTPTTVTRASLAENDGTETLRRPGGRSNSWRRPSVVMTTIR